MKKREIDWQKAAEVGKMATKTNEIEMNSKSLNLVERQLSFEYVSISLTIERMFTKPDQVEQTKIKRLKRYLRRMSRIGGF